MRVLAGGPARETSSDLYRLHCDGLRAQAFDGCEIVVRHEIVPDVGGPRWHHDKIERVAKARQAMMEAVHDDFGVHGREAWVAGAPAIGADALFMIDTDVIVGPGVLERLWAVDADVVVGVMWTRSDWGQPVTSDVAPQVWFTNPYSWHPNDIPAMTCWNALCEPGVNEVEIKGGGAVTLIRGRGFESHYWPLFDSLRAAPGMWGGEDRTYCLGLEARGIRMVGVTGLPIVHLYTPELRTPAKLAEARKLVGLVPSPTSWG